ncbi:hypothetical protein [Sphingobium sp. EP60837]|uniref:hypothetical protein n=1 Tax=Sphingobium sp. EP60837 TaxID=1855519 RepID=UPI0012E7866B|nr:hypothetical protein [Sphingobium sp. EP60837]
MLKIDRGAKSDGKLHGPASDQTAGTNVAAWESNIQQVSIILNIPAMDRVNRHLSNLPGTDLELV